MRIEASVTGRGMEWLAFPAVRTIAKSTYLSYCILLGIYQYSSIHILGDIRLDKEKIKKAYFKISRQLFSFGGGLENLLRIKAEFAGVNLSFAYLKFSFTLAPRRKPTLYIIRLRYKLDNNKL